MIMIFPEHYRLQRRKLALCFQIADRKNFRNCPISLNSASVSIAPNPAAKAVPPKVDPYYPFFEFSPNHILVFEFLFITVQSVFILDCRPAR